MKHLMNWTAAGMMMVTLAAFSPVIAETADKSEMAEFREWKQRKDQNLQKRDERRKAMHEKRMERMAKELGLSEKQKTAISKIIEKSWQEVANEKRAFTDKVKQIRENSDKSIEKELSKEQIQKWQEHKSRMMKRDRKKTSSQKNKESMRGDKMQRDDFDCYDHRDYGRGEE